MAEQDISLQQWIASRYGQIGGGDAKPSEDDRIPQKDLSHMLGEIAADPDAQLTPAQAMTRGHHKEVGATIQSMQKYLWQKPALRHLFNLAGLHLAPANYYSNLPTIQEVLSSFEYLEPRPPYLDDSLFDNAKMVALLDELQPFAEEFSPKVDGDVEHPAGFYWNNPMFVGSDAMAYYGMIRRYKPARIVEIGSGFSTLIAAEALRRNGAGELYCLEPYPRAFLRTLPGVTRLIEKPVQAMPREFFQDVLRDGDFLFIDSTHTVKVGSDCLHLYLRVLPALTQRIVIHAHDIFLPEAYPVPWILNHHIYWTEQYLLMAYLLGNPSYEVMFGSNYHQVLNRERLERYMVGKGPVGGSSFWFKRV